MGSTTQLQRAVNRKLARRGDPRRIRSHRDGYLTLKGSNIVQPPIRRKKRHLPPAKRPSVGAAIEGCQQLLQQWLEQGVCRSRDVEQICCVERGFSRRAYFEARGRLGLRAVKVGNGQWELVMPTPEPPEKRP